MSEQRYQEQLKLHYEEDLAALGLLVKVMLSDDNEQLTEQLVASGIDPGTIAAIIRDTMPGIERRSEATMHLRPGQSPKDEWNAVLEFCYRALGTQQGKQIVAGVLGMC